MIDLITGEAVAALVQGVMIDLVLAGDNAVVIALAAAGLPPYDGPPAPTITGLISVSSPRFAQVTVGSGA